MQRVITVFLFLVGLISTLLLVAYVFALFVFVFGESNYPGDIAFVPKWIFLFSPLIFLWRTKIIQRFLSRLEKI